MLYEVITEVIFSPGNYSTSFSKENLNINEEWVVLTSNYIGFMMEQAILRNFKKVVIVGHLGKLRITSYNVCYTKLLRK